MIAPHITVELILGDRTHPVANLSIDEPCGSMESVEPDGTRHIYVFGWRDDQLGVWESIGGIDTANTAIREIITTDLTLISDLTQPYNLTIHRGGNILTVRFTANLKTVASGDKGKAS